MILSEFWATNKVEILISSGFVLISILLMVALSLSNKRGDKKSKQFTITSAFLSLMLFGINYLLIVNIYNPTLIKFSENFSIEISPLIRLIVINIVLMGIYTLLVVQAYKKKDNKKMTTTNVAIMGILVSVSSVLMLFSIPIFPPAPFLKLEVSGLIIFMVFIWFDVKTAIIVSILTNLIHVLMPGTSAPIILFLDEFVNFIATMSFLAPSLLLIKKNEYNKVSNGNKIAYVIIVGVLFTTVFMVLYNFLFNLPIVYGMEWEFLNVLYIFGLFNIIKWGSVGFLIIILWKKLEPLMNVRQN